MNKKFIVLAVLVLAILVVGVYWFYTGQVSDKNVKLLNQAKTYCSQKNVAGVYVYDDYIRVVGSLLGAGSTYYPANGGQSFSCPVVGPDSMSAECKQMLQNENNWQTVCENKV